MKLLLFIFLILSLNVQSQKILRINRVYFNSFKTSELFMNDVLEYKLKGQHRYKTAKIVGLQDSLIILSNDSIIKLSQIKSIKLKANHRLTKLFSSAFIYAGVGLLLVDSFNNAINDTSPILRQETAIVSVSLVSVGIIISQIGIKRIRLNNRNTIKIIDLTIIK